MPILVPDDESLIDDLVPDDESLIFDPDFDELGHSAIDEESFQWQAGPNLSPAPSTSDDDSNGRKRGVFLPPHNLHRSHPPSGPHLGTLLGSRPAASRPALLLLVARRMNGMIGFRSRCFR